MPLLDSSNVVQPAFVLICGLQGVGKTTAARWLADRHGFRLTSFADPIRAALVAAGAPAACFQGAAKTAPCDELGGVTPRVAMEQLGDLGRVWSPLMWIRAWDRGLGPDPLQVVDDARYDLEVAYALGTARRRGVSCDRPVVRCAVVQVTRPDGALGTAHESNRIPDVPAGVPVLRVVNAGTVSDLGRAVESALRDAGVLT